MYENLLREAGLTKNESLVYMALLRIGESKSGAIVKEAHVSGGKIYETLYKLVEKGLVKSVVKNGVKYFVASDPTTIMDYIREKQLDLGKKANELGKILPRLHKMAADKNDSDMVYLIKGIRGIHTIVYGALENGNDIRIMGVTSSKNMGFNNFWTRWHKRRVKLRKNARLLFSDTGSEYWRFFKNLKHTEVREILSFSPSAVMIIDDNVFVFSYENGFTCIHVVSHSISNSFSAFFDSLWKFSKSDTKKDLP